MTRRAVSPARKRRVCINQAAAQGTPLLCPLCGHPIKAVETTTLEHMVPLALGGADDDGEDNLRMVHKPCAMKKTNGTDAIAGHRGDITAIRKAERLARGGKKRGPGPKGRKSIPYRTADGVCHWNGKETRP